MRSGKLATPATAAILLMLAHLVGCATPTPYQPDLPGQSVSGGYSEERIEDNRYRVTFSGNCFTSRDRVEGYLLYRAAELTVERGYDWFSIVDRLTERDARTYVEPDPFYRPYYGAAYPYWRPHWSYYSSRYGWRIWHPEWGDPFWADRMTLRRTERFTAHAEIVMERGAVPAQNERAFDARQVISDLEPQIERPASGTVQPC